MIEVKNLSKSFGEKGVLLDLNFSVTHGQSVAIVGKSGAGKSVLLKCLIGLVKPDEGTIYVDNKLINSMSFGQLQEIRSNIGMVFQFGALFDSMKVWENVAFGLVQGRGMKRKDAQDIAIEKLKAVGLKPETGNLYPAELSGGMQKRVGLARAIATSPEIIFFDEPTTGLDPIMADVINDLIVESVKDIGATALSITHDMASARKIADIIAMIYDGKIIWHGSVEEMDKTDNPYVDQFIHGRAHGPITKHSSQILDKTG